MTPRGTAARVVVAMALVGIGVNVVGLLVLAGWHLLPSIFTGLVVEAIAAAAVCRPVFGKAGG